MRSTINPAEFDWEIDIVVQNMSLVNGEETPGTPTTYSNIRAKKLRPLKGVESEETNQNVAQERNSWQIRKENYSFVPKHTAVVENSKNHEVIAVREFKGERYYLVLDTEYRDNQ